MEKNYLSYLRNRAELTLCGIITVEENKDYVERLNQIQNDKKELHKCYEFDLFSEHSTCINRLREQESFISLFQQVAARKAKEEQINLELDTILKKLDINTIYYYLDKQGMETEMEMCKKYLEILQNENFEDCIFELFVILSYDVAARTNLSIEKMMNNLKKLLLNNEFANLYQLNMVQIIIDKTINKEVFDVLLKMNFIFSEYIDCFVNFNKLDKSGIYDKFFVGKYVCNNKENKKQEQLISSKLESDYSKNYDDNSLLSEKDVLYMKYLAMKAEEYSLEDKMLVEEFMALDEKIKKGYKLKGFELCDLVVNMIFVTLKEANIRLANYCCIKDKGVFRERDWQANLIVEAYNLMCAYLISFLERMKKEYYDLYLSGKDKLALEKISYIDQVVMYQKDFVNQLNGEFNIDTVIGNFDRIGDGLRKLRKPKKD